MTTLGRPIPWTLGILSFMAPHGAAHVGPELAVRLGQGDAALMQVLSALATAAIVLVGFAYLRWRARRGQRPDASWALVLLGVAWVVASVAKPPVWGHEWWWRLVAAGLVLGTVIAAWTTVWPRVRAAWTAARPGRNALSGGVMAAGVFLVLFAFGTHIVAFADAHETAAAGPHGFVLAYESFGPLAMWPDVEFWWPAANMWGHVTPASAAIALSAAALFGLAITFLVTGFSRRNSASVSGAGLASVATNFCACCTPAIYPVLVALFGSGATPLVYAMSDPDLGLYNAAQVGNLWLLTLAVSVGAKRVVDTCRPGGPSPSSPTRPTTPSASSSDGVGAEP